MKLDGNPHEQHARNIKRMLTRRRPVELLTGSLRAAERNFTTRLPTGEVHAAIAARTR